MSWFIMDVRNGSMDGPNLNGLMNRKNVFISKYKNNTGLYFSFDFFLLGMYTNDELKQSSAEYGRYFYSDPMEWQTDEMVELIKGKIFRSAAAATKKKINKCLSPA